MNKMLIAFIVIIAAAFVVAGCTQSATDIQSSRSPSPSEGQTPPAQTPPVDQSQPPVTNPIISYDAQLTYKTYGGNMNPATSVRELTVNSTTATLSVLSSDNVLQSSTSMSISNTIFHNLVDSMNANNFLELSDVYGGKNPDTGNLQMSVAQADITKSVTLGPIGDSPPVSVQTIIAMFQSIEDNFSQTSDTKSTTPSVQLMVNSNNLVVDGNGIVVYTFDQDTNGRSACYDTCANYWPPVFVGVDSPAAGIVPGTIGMVQRTDGSYQATYDGQPLYYYVQDKNPGDMNGNNLNVSGGVWYVVNATG